jgi:transcriptional regulator with XRE-family HTH domain
MGPMPVITSTLARQLSQVAHVPTWTLADRLLKARTNAGMGQVELAQITGLSRQTVSNYERGIVTPRRSGVELWALATGVPLGWLLTGEEPE